MENYEVLMRNKVTGVIHGCIVVADSMESSYDGWFEVFENESESISEDDMPENWKFESSVVLKHCDKGKALGRSEGIS